MKVTHIGELRCALWKNAHITMLRETKLYYVDSRGVKYKKKDGYLVGLYVRVPSAPYLDLNSIKPIE